MRIQFWEDYFKDDNTFLFGSAPNKTIIEYEHLFENDWYVLDVGCGDGKNSLYLAKQGFENIDAFDISETAVGKIKRLCSNGGYKINTYVTSVATFKFEKKYDLILSFGVFHFMPKEEWKAFVKKAQDNTNVGGIHIIQLFNDNIPATPDIGPYAVGMAKDGEIKELYKDWEIIEFLSYSFNDEHPGVPLHKHASNKIVARKIK